MASRDTPKAPSNLVAFPSVSSALCALPQATHLQDISLHPCQYAHRAAESEAKLQKALTKTASSFTPMAAQSPYANLDFASTQAQGFSEPLMMKTKRS